MEGLTRNLLAELGLPEGYVGWTMVALATEFWREQVAAVPPARRLLLLPHCLRPADGCPAEYSQFGLDCGPCGACSIADFRVMAERLGYRVIVAEGSPVVMQIILGGYVDAILGVACLNVLEKAIDKILLAGIPCMAVPLALQRLPEHFGRHGLGQRDDSRAASSAGAADGHLHSPAACGLPVVRARRAGPVGGASAGRTAIVGNQRQGIGGLGADCGHRGDCLRLPDQGRQARASVHYVGGLRRTDRRAGYLARRRQTRGGLCRRGETHGDVDRDVSQSFAGPRRHRRRRPLPLRPRYVAPQVRRFPRR